MGKPRSPRAAFGNVELQEQRGGRFTKLLAGFILLAAVVVGIAFASELRNMWREFRGHDPLYATEQPPNLGEIDLEEVHQSLVPDWMLRRQEEQSFEDGEAASEKTRVALREALAPDANLLELFNEIDGAMPAGGIAGEPGVEHILWLTRAWNQYLDRNDAPYFLRGAATTGKRRMLVLYTYEVVGEGMVRVDGDDRRVRALSRLDRFNKWESLHQSESREGPVVLVERSSLFATHVLWPLFASEARLPRNNRAFADDVVAEAERDLGAEVVSLLRATADVWVLAVEARAELRGRCRGSAVPNMPWNGFDEETVERFGSGRACTARPAEVSALQAVRDTFAEEHRAAVEKLIAWTARSVALSEARRCADGYVTRSDEPKAPCPICAGDDNNALRAEVSAVLGEWAWTTTPAATLLRACHENVGGVPGDTRWLQHTSRPLNFAYPAATKTLLEELEYSCSEGPHPNLNEAARALAASAFDRDEPIEIEAFPERLPVVSARRRVWKQRRDAEDPPP